MMISLKALVLEATQASSVVVSRNENCWHLTASDALSTVPTPGSQTKSSAVGLDPLLSSA